MVGGGRELSGDCPEDVVIVVQNIGGRQVGWEWEGEGVRVVSGHDDSIQHRQSGLLMITFYLLLVSM